MRIILLLLLALCTPFAHAQQVNLENRGTYVYDFYNGAARIRNQTTTGWVQLPNHPYDPMSFHYGVQSAPMPAGVTTHAMSFWFYSDGYFGNNPGDSDHAAIMLKGSWTPDNPATPAYEAFIQGRGAILGSLNPDPNVKHHGSSAVELWGGTSSHVPTVTVQQGLRDYTWYKVTIHSNAVGVGYDVRDQSNNIVHSYSIADTWYPNIPTNLGGWFIAATNTSNTSNWSLTFSDVQIWWF